MFRRTRSLLYLCEALLLCRLVVCCLTELIWTPRCRFDTLTSAISALLAAENSSLISCPKKMAKRVQEQKEEETIVAKSRPTALNLSSTVPASSSSSKNLIASSDPRKLMAAGKLASKTRRNSKPDEASSSQVKLKDVFFGGLMDESAEKPAAFNVSEFLRNPEAERRKWPHNYYILCSRVSHGQSPFDCEKDLRSRTDGRNGGPQRERENVENVYEYHSSSSSSSWSGL